VTSVEKTASFSVEVPPKIISNLEDFEVAENGTAVITISVMAQPLPTFKWMKGNLDLKGASSFDGRINVKHSDSYSTLMISRLTRQDCGTYMCKIQNSAGISWQTIKISHIPDSNTDTFLRQNRKYKIEKMSAGQKMFSSQAEPSFWRK